MVQIYIIKLIASPELKSICLNQQQYDSLLEIVDGCDMKKYPEDFFKIVTVETLNNCFYYKETTLTCEQAIMMTSLAMHINISQLKSVIMKNLIN